jgi:hypothetical protein
MPLLCERQQQFKLVDQEDSPSILTEKKIAQRAQK